jgi:hypothetical protein
MAGNIPQTGLRRYIAYMHPWDLARILTFAESSTPPTEGF